MYMFVLYTRETTTHMDGSSTMIGMHNIFDSRDKAIGNAGIVKDDHLTKLNPIAKEIKDKFPSVSLYLPDEEMATKFTVTALHAIKCFIAAVDKLLGRLNRHSMPVLPKIVNDLIPMTTARKF
jgi:hypothetical protein